MKKTVLVFLGCVLISTFVIMGCPNTSDPSGALGSSEKEEIEKGYDADGAVLSSLSTAELKASDDSKTYLFDGDYMYEAKASSDWSANISSDVFITEGNDTDKIVKLNYDLQGKENKLDVNFIQGTKDFSSSVWTTKFYIPDAMTAPGSSSYPQICFYAKYDSADMDWDSTYIAKLNTITIGSGWHTVSLDFENWTVKIDDGEALTEDDGSSTFFDAKVKENIGAIKLVGMELYGNELPETMEGAYLYIDYTNITGISVAAPEAPVITCTDNVVSLPLEDGNKVYYTIDGTTPTSESTEYTSESAIAVTAENSPLTVKAIIIRTSDNKSSSVSEKECTFVDTGVANKSVKVTFTETVDGEQKPNIPYFEAGSTDLAVKSITVDLYVPQATYDAGFTGGKIYYKTGDGWSWNEGAWTTITAADTWQTVSVADIAVAESLKCCGFNFYNGSGTATSSTDLVMYFDNFIVTYSDDSTDSFNFNEATGVSEKLKFNSDTSGTGALALDTDIYN